MSNSLIIGGSNGIGLAIALEFLKDRDNRVNIIDKTEPDIDMNKYPNLNYYKVNLLNDDFSFLEQFNDIDILVITAGFGRVAKFDTIQQAEISNSFQVNTISVIKTLNFFFKRMLQKQEFKCAVMGSIAGLVSSPLFALYGATKSAICSIIESLNIELEKSGTNNRILNVSPGAIKGTKFEGGENNIAKTEKLAQQIIHEMNAHHTLFIPQYDEIFKNVIDRYRNDAHQFGIESYQYKIDGGRYSNKPQLKIGYLSGTFDLFHIGHLNLLKKAKQYCDYLVVGVHKDASHKGKQAFISFEERCEIVKSVKYVNQVIESEKEDCDVYLNGIVKYDYLFVGSDYKGTERFNRYEELFKDKGVEIIYFPYTQGTSSTQLRKVIER